MKSVANFEDSGERAAATYTLTGSAKLNSLDPGLYLRPVLERIAKLLRKDAEPGEST